MKTLIIIPAFNERGNIQSVVELVKEKCSFCDYVIINDGSTDGTKELCLKNGYNVISHPLNMGLSAAVQTGMLYALIHGYDAAIQIDGDGQHNPEYIKDMIPYIENGYDMVIGSRFKGKKRPKTIRMFGSRLLSFAIRITTKTVVSDPTSGMRMYNKEIIKKIAENADLGPEPDTVALLIRRGARSFEIPVVMRNRTMGESYFGPASSIGYMMRMVLSILVLQWFRRGY